MKTIQRGFRAALLMAAAASVLAFASGAKAQDKDDHDSHSNDNTWPYATTGKSPVLAVVGDVSCQPAGTKETLEKKNETCTDSLSKVNASVTEPLVQAQAATANQIEKMKPDLVALVGDEQYQVGQYSDFESSYDLTYGAFKFITRPAPGNHEFYDEHGAVGVLGYGYFSYFNGVQHCLTIIPNVCSAADGSVEMTTVTDPSISTAYGGGTIASSGGMFTSPVPLPDGQAGHFEETGGLGSGTGGAVGVGDGWYSYNLGAWHLISLNIECENQQGGCPGPGVGTPSPVNYPWFASEFEWLKKDLEENHSACTVAYWHQPTFSAVNSLSLEGATAQAFWQLLYEHGADLVLNGHDHVYARYRPLDPSGKSDPRHGIREFIVGTGGETLDILATTGTSSDPSGDTNFNTENIEAATADYYGVMALTLEPNGYKWDFESALKDPAQTSAPATYTGDEGFGTCHGSPDRDRDDDDHGR